MCSEKNGKERRYYSLVNKEDYLRFETENFMQRYRQNSFSSPVVSLYGGGKLLDNDREALTALLCQKDR